MTDAEYRIDPEEAVAAAIDAAEEIDDSVADEVLEKPRLLVDKSNPHQTVATLRDILAEAGGLYDRGVPVRLAVDQTQKGTVAQIMTRSGVVLRAKPAPAPDREQCRQQLGPPLTHLSANVVLKRSGLRILGAGVELHRDEAASQIFRYAQTVTSHDHEGR
jgi:DNA replication initiation complex subunit (GINS family)